jgi:uncharacterized protein (TIGR02246 family)
MKVIIPRSVLAGAAGALILAAGCAQQSAPPTTQDHSGISSATDVKSHLRTLDAELVAALAAKNIDKVSGFYADDAQFLEPGTAPAVGREEIHKSWAALITSPSFVSLTFSANAVNVSEAGDVAWEVGTYDASTKDPKGKPTAEKGKYVLIWKKQADGNWKIEVDMNNPGT